ncbi:MAG: preprotein translocase subunit SecE [Anaerolineales bacterium]|nr:preprotein translocase subunit SecE [Anaerolineales bacterium]
MSKAQPAVKEPNFIVRFYRETVGELRKVVWPTWSEARNLTIIVLLVIVSGSIFLGFFDWLFSESFKFLLSLVPR